MRARILAMMAMTLVTGAVCAQQQQPMAKDAKPGFEVAAIRPSDPAAEGNTIDFEGQRFIVRNMKVSTLIQFAYGLHKEQIVNAPEWVTEKFDVNGTPDTPGMPSLPQMQSMVQKLLVGRFGFKFHREQKELSTYAIAAAKGGIKLTATTDTKVEGPTMHLDGGAHRMSGQFTRVTMEDLALCLQGMADRPVVNQTGLVGLFNFSLAWNPDLSFDGESSDVPALGTAMREQLGLKLDAKKAPVSVVVVDALTRPTDN